MQPYFYKYIGIPVVIENMEGAGGNAARAFVAGDDREPYRAI